MLKPSAEVWDERWRANRTGWDLGQPTAALVSVLDEYKHVIRFSDDSTVLIPGCGRAYDAVYIASQLLRGKTHAQVMGIDISPTAVQAAKEHAALQANDDHADIAQLRFEAVDFFDRFEDELGMSGRQGFSLVFDHTFLCAIKHEERDAWGRRMGELIAPSGHLICIMWPLRPHDETGPPYSLSIQLYHDLLDQNFDLVVMRALRPDEKPDNSSLDRDKLGEAQISIWVRKAI